MFLACANSPECPEIAESLTSCDYGYILSDYGTCHICPWCDRDLTTCTVMCAVADRGRRYDSGACRCKFLKVDSILKFVILLCSKTI